MKNIKIKVVIIFLCLILVFGLIFLILKYNSRIENIDNLSHTENELNVEAIKGNEKSELKVDSLNEINSIDSNLLAKEEISTYWENYTNPEHWSENTNNYTLAYILDSNKNLETNIEEKSNTIIENELPSSRKGVFVPKDSRKQLEDFLKNNIDDKFYINEDGFINYIINENSFEVESDLTNLVNKLIFDSEKLTILSIAYSYYDENNEIDSFATSIPIELNYLRFNPKEDMQLLIYSQYNFSLESFTEGIENLTGETIKTK